MFALTRCPEAGIPVRPNATVDPVIGDEPLAGVVTGNNVRVRAGAVVAPAHADEVQTMLDKGDTVQVIGARDDYYKIVPPANCYFWVAREYIKPIRMADQETIVAGAAQAGSVVMGKPVNNELGTATAAAASKAQADRKMYDQLARAFIEEKAKPILTQDYNAIGEKLAVLIAETESPSVKLSARSLLAQARRSQMAAEASKLSLDQDRKLTEILKAIDQQVQDVQSQPEPSATADAAAMLQGLVRRSAAVEGTVPDPQRLFYLTDSTGHIAAYLESGYPALELAGYVGKTAKVWGTMSYDAFADVRVMTVQSIRVVEP